jgi:peptide/nickel transport system substrate-binding protein
MKGLFIALVVLLVSSFVLAACSSTAPSAPSTAPAATTAAAITSTTARPATTTSSSTGAPPATSTAPALTSVTATTTGQGVYGGTLRRIQNAFPKTLGYPPEFTPTDSGFAALALERLITWDAKGNIIPVLATSWDEDPVNKTLTWHLRQGVKFTDGSDWNATVLKWNFDQQIPSGRLTGGNLVDSITIVDNYTVKMHVTAYNRMHAMNFGWIMIASQAAFEKAAGGDIEKGKAWARLNAVGTGPYMITDFKRDVSMTYTRNDNYWRVKPYLDAIQQVLIPDTMTSAVMMRAKGADAWAAADIQNAIDLEKQGLTVNYGTGMFMTLDFNSSDPNSKYNNIKVRQAINYAINRPALAQTIGFGKYEAVTQLANSKYLGYNPGYDPYAYNVAKAKALLTEAGFPNGFKTKILTNSLQADTATSIQGYLKDIGIQADLDVADAARYSSSLFLPGQGWSDLAVSLFGINPDATDVFVHFGPTPMTYRTGSIYKSPEYLALCNTALQTYDQTQYVTVLKQIIKQATDDVMVVPLYTTVAAYPMQSYVHSYYPSIHGLVWDSWADWMGPH